MVFSNVASQRPMEKPNTTGLKENYVIIKWFLMSLMWFCNSHWPEPYSVIIRETSSCR